MGGQQITEDFPVMLRDRDERIAALEELVGELAKHPDRIGKSWRLNERCVHCWASRLVRPQLAQRHSAAAKEAP
jgi:hypothetical protein